MRGSRLGIFILATVLVVVATATFVVGEAFRRHAERAEAPAPETTDLASVQARPRIVFRNATRGDDNGLVAMVPLDAPGGPRAVTGVECDRVDASEDTASCLRSERGVLTQYRWSVLGPGWEEQHDYPLPGIPSRTRLSSDGRLMASTSFVTGHSYMQVGFSTATVIRSTGGRSYGNLERFALRIDGQAVRPVDRNIWGVTFVDDRTFYATVATGGKTYLAKGDLEDRTLESLRSNAECPSLSPDGSRIAYKKVTRPDHWTIAVLDLDSDTETLLSGETRSVDDQVEWLDDETLLYGMSREGELGVSDVWALATTEDAAPERLVDNAWSPSVVDG